MELSTAALSDHASAKSGSSFRKLQKLPVNQITGLLVRKNRQFLYRPLFFIGARSAFQMIFEFFAEFLYERDGRHGGGIAQGAERPAEHVFRQVLHVIDIFLQ